MGQRDSLGTLPYQRTPETLFCYMYPLVPLNDGVFRAKKYLSSRQATDCPSVKQGAVGKERWILEFIRVFSWQLFLVIAV